MGLDMWLEKEIFIGAQYEHCGITGTVDIQQNGVKIPIQFNRISSITELIGCWRKANSIHAWFVENVQDGKDECQRTGVSYSEFVKLLNVCKKVLSNPKKYANTLLPTQSGFFFGSTDYDEDYLDDIRHTIKIIEPIVQEGETGISYFYSSSW